MFTCNTRLYLSFCASIYKNKTNDLISSNSQKTASANEAIYTSSNERGLIQTGTSYYFEKVCRGASDGLFRE